MPKRHADSTQDENPPKTGQLSADEVLVEAAKKGDTTSVRAVLEKLPADSKTVVFDAVHETCRGNHDECLALLLPHVETTQVGFGILLSECVHANHVACTEVLLQHWKSVCKNEEFVPHVSKHSAGQSAGVCPAMWSDPAVCRVLIDAGAPIEAKDENGLPPLHVASVSGALDIVKMLVEAGAGVRVTDNQGQTCLALAAYFGHTDIVRYLVGLPEVDTKHACKVGMTALRCAVDRKHANVVQVLIDAGADIDTKNENGRSPLHSAIQLGALDIVKMLVEAGAGVRIADNEGATCLHLAAYFGHTDAVRYLVGLPEVEFNHTANAGDTALHCAVHEKHANVVQVLIDAGADVGTKDTEGASPLHSACISGALDIVKMLVEAGAGVSVPNIEGATCLTLASYFGHIETVRYLVGLPEVDVNYAAEVGLTALHCAVHEKHADVVQVLIDAGADIDTKNKDGTSPLRAACASGALDVMKMLVEAGAGVCVTDDEGVTCLTLAAYFGHTETVRYLVGLPEVNVNHAAKRGETALQCAVKGKHVNVARVLLDAGADMELKDKDGLSPLHAASLAGALDVVTLLVEAGAGVRVTDNNGNACLILASACGHTETVRYLVGLPDIEVSYAAKVGMTALRFAVDRKHADVVQVLIAAGADINIKNNDGTSPLHSASHSGALDNVKMLVEAGAGVNVTDNEGAACLHLAAYFGHTETVRYLVGLPEVDVNHAAEGRITALHCAVKEQHADVVQVLIDAGADMDTTNEDGLSPLQVALQSKAAEVVDILVRSGAGVRSTGGNRNMCLLLSLGVAMWVCHRWQ